MFKQPISTSRADNPGTTVSTISLALRSLDIKPFQGIRRRVLMMSRKFVHVFWRRQVVSCCGVEQSACYVEDSATVRMNVLQTTSSHLCTEYVTVVS